MANHDYSKLGFKCGIEIHQQLDTHNLFCNCPPIVHDKDPKLVAKRKLKAVVGETGEVDVAAAHEQDKAKEMIYEGCERSHCLVEIDEEPPHSINKEAVSIAIQVAKMLHMDLVDEIQVMRKTVVDGSNVGGFQRTALVAMDGYIDTSKGQVPIPLLCLEEEAAKKIQNESKDSLTYRLDRLGVCLIEVSTDASIKDAEHAKECAEILGMILRSTGKVRRGIGTIRQDVNVSIKGGVRIEVKGFQDLKSIPKVIDFEIVRQQKIIAAGEKMKKEVRKAEPDMTTSFMRPMPGGARMYPETDILPITISKELFDSIKIPELISDKKDDLIKKYKLDEGIIKELINKGIDFNVLVKEYSNVEPKFIASVLIQAPKELGRKGIDVDKLNDEDYREILSYLNDGKIPKGAVAEIIEKKANGEKIDLSAYKGVDDSKLEEEVKKIIKEKPGLNIGGYMGLIMAKFQGKVDGKKVSQILGKLLK